MYSVTRATTAPSVARMRNFFWTCLVWELASARRYTCPGRRTSHATPVTGRQNPLLHFTTARGVLFTVCVQNINFLLQLIHEAPVRRVRYSYPQLLATARAQSTSVRQNRFLFHQVNGFFFLFSGWLNTRGGRQYFLRAVTLARAGPRKDRKSAKKR